MWAQCAFLADIDLWSHQVHPVSRSSLFRLSDFAAHHPMYHRRLDLSKNNLNRLKGLQSCPEVTTRPIVLCMFMSALLSPWYVVYLLA